MTEFDETDGMTALDHVKHLLAYAPKLKLDYALFNSAPISAEMLERYAAEGRRAQAAGRQMPRIRRTANPAPFNSSPSRSFRNRGPCAMRPKSSARRYLAFIAGGFPRPSQESLMSLRRQRVEDQPRTARERRDSWLIFRRKTQ